ncbi:hypothetical protein OK18_14575 [Chryseobacterium gallinarum]|uniref:Uncharacterized protein n=1 Tax=Chryseobacterium gallinarum TaxID=1324352 RepID=A0A0G3M6Q5_CHRGL|nr:hypothetical protein [Chryseobacterium gallinarum]AKK73663.1 hypothetical protein OK18_14575 [Chryseobacterium gallinarum]
MNDITEFELTNNETYFSNNDSYLSFGFIVNDLTLTKVTNLRSNFIRHDFQLPIYEITRNFHEKEQIYITAIRNLLKQKRYLNLMYELSNEYITEDEFNDELENNEDQYLIKTDNRLDSINKINNLSSVISKIDVDFDEEDLFEIFSVSISLNLLNQKNTINSSND